MIKNRTVILSGELTDGRAGHICSQLIDLDTEDTGCAIFLHINSTGGSLSAGMSIIDTIRYLVKSPVITTCTGVAAGISAVILASGAYLYSNNEYFARTATPHAKISISQLADTENFGETQLSSNYKKEVIETIYEILAQNTGKNINEIKILCQTSQAEWLSATEAKDLNLIDGILTKTIDISDIPELSFEKTSIAKLNMSARAFNCLMMANIDTIQKLTIIMAANPDRIKCMHGIGKKSFYDIQKCLNTFYKQHTN